MFRRYVSLAASASPVYPEVITGRELDRRIEQSNPTQLALSAYDLSTGTTRVERFTNKQARLLTRASYGYCHTVAVATDRERAALRGGFLSLSELHNRPPSHAAVDRIVARLGAERVLDALDRLTRPTVPAANDNSQMSFPFVGQHVAAAE